MTGIYVLIVIVQVYWGYNVSMQEFTSLEKCEGAKQVIAEIIWLSDKQKAECVPK
jgi:hypothetical protein